MDLDDDSMTTQEIGRAALAALEILDSYGGAAVAGSNGWVEDEMFTTVSCSVVSCCAVVVLWLTSILRARAWFQK